MTARRALLAASLILILYGCASTAGISPPDRSHLSQQQRWSNLLLRSPEAYKRELLESREQGFPLIEAERLVYSEPAWQSQAILDLVLSSEIGVQLDRFGLSQDLTMFKLRPLGLTEFERFKPSILASLSVDLKPVGLLELAEVFDSHMEGGDIYINVNFSNRQAAMSFVYEYAIYKLMQLPFSNLLTTAGFGAVFDELPCPRGENSSIPPGTCRDQVERFCREWIAHMMLIEFYLHLNRTGFSDEFGERLVEMNKQRILGRALAKMNGLKIDNVYPLLKRTDGITVIFE